jgi:hypothetical protein
MHFFRALCLTTFVGAAFATPAQAFDFDHELAPFVIGPAVLPSIYAVSPSGGDATLVLRMTLMFTTGWFDATAPYTPHSVAVYSHLGRRPAAEHTQANMNIACFYASYHVAMAQFPHQEAEWRNMLFDVGLDPDDDSTDLTTPVGIGNVAGMAVVAAKEHDGMNMLGDGNGRGASFRRPYEDTTGYQPRNTAYRLSSPSHWQPAMVNNRGIYSIQQFVTPQYATSQPHSFDDVSIYEVPRPKNSDWDGNNKGYRAQAAQVLAVSASLTDEQKMLAELFNDKLLSLGQSTGVQAFIRGLNLRQIIELDMINHVAAYDTGIAIWKEKIRYDAVRPFSAIRKIYAGQKVTAWAGPGLGVRSDVPGEHWESYLAVADHPEYPSGSQAFCSAHATSMRAYFGDDAFGWPVVFPAGSSRVEPGVTPAQEIVYVLETWTKFETVCGLTRNWGGVHFLDAIEASKPIGHEIGQIASEWVLAHIDGTIGGD